MKVYISGKVTGLPIHEVTMKFGQAVKEIEALELTAINPLAVVNDWKAKWPDAMRKCIIALMEADVMYMLPDGDESKGALLEFMIAQDLELPVVFSALELKQWINDKEAGYAVRI